MKIEDYMRIIENVNLTARVMKKMCRSKKKRIIKKWKKNLRNYSNKPDPNYYVVPHMGLIICHPATAHRLRTECGYSEL